MKAVITLIATFSVSFVVVVVPMFAHAEANDAINAILAIQQREQLLDQSKKLGNQVANLQTQYAATIQAMAPLRQQLEAADRECNDTCTPAQERALIDSMNKFTKISMGATFATVAVRATIAGIQRTQNKITAQEFDATLARFARPWKYLTGRIFLGSAVLFGASAYLNHVNELRDAPTLDKRRHIEAQLVIMEGSLSGINQNIANLEAQMKPITEALQTNIDIAKFNQEK